MHQSTRQVANAAATKLFLLCPYYLDLALSNFCYPDLALSNFCYPDLALSNFCYPDLALSNFCYPDLALSNFCLFPNLKTNLHGRNFGSNEGIIDAVDEYLGNQEEGFYFERISRLEQHWRKCIKAKGD